MCFHLGCKVVKCFLGLFWRGYRHWSWRGIELWRNRVVGSINKGRNEGEAREVESLLLRTEENTEERRGNTKWFLERQNHLIQWMIWNSSARKVITLPDGFEVGHFIWIKTSCPKPIKRQLNTVQAYVALLYEFSTAENMGSTLGQKIMGRSWWVALEYLYPITTRERRETLCCLRNSGADRVKGGWRERHDILNGDGLAVG